MTREMYESPEFDFQEMKLAERVAEQCWGYAYAWYDANGNGVIDEKWNDANGDGDYLDKDDSGVEKVDLVSLGLGKNGCQGTDAETKLYNYFKTFDQTGNLDKPGAVKVNTKSPYVQPIGSVR